nr:TonB-dependent receptor [uncultured Dyadobacter sp.]
MKNTRYILPATIWLALNSFAALAQTDSARKDIPNENATQARLLPQLNVFDYHSRFTQSLPEIKGTYLFAGKRSEVIRLADIEANIAEKTGRQLFARIPGVFVYDMDGTGNQLNIATRGLDPHRSWEMNIRQNGVITNSDMYGYPASHYSAPMESISQIELVRGTASLQYGAQFGGMLNYVTKQADTTRRVGFENVSSVGSYGLLSTYNALGGRIGKWTYYAYHYARKSKGYRENGRSEAGAQFVSLQYQASKALLLKAEVGRSHYTFRIPGPLTDSLFHANPRQATRSRNYFNPDIWVPSLTIDWKIAGRTRLTFTNSALLGSRNSVQFDALATVKDTLTPETGQFKQRQVDIDHFKSFTSELRLLHSYQFLHTPATIATGLQYMNNNLHRQQLGKGTTGSDFDLNITGPFGRDLHFKTRNVAFFIENQFQITPALCVSPGLRIENGDTKMSGTITYYTPERLPTKISHRFALLGINAQYVLTPEIKLYGGISQAYRPVLFKDVIPASTYEEVDDNLKDASGYNAEVGIKGMWKGLNFNVSVFDLLYKNKMGSIVLPGDAGTATVLRTNVGDSRNVGLEALIEGVLCDFGKLRMTWFTSTSYIHARYRNATIATGTENKNIDGNHVESVPEWTSRNGLTGAYRNFRATIQYSYVSKTFSDALNTPVPQASGAKGPVPAYSLWDLNASWQISPSISVRGSVSNMLDKSYFTKRPTFYPGPGIWPSDGRSGTLTVAISI